MRIHDLMAPLLAMQMMPTVTTKCDTYLKSTIPPNEYKRRKKRTQMAKKSRSINRRK